MKPSVITIVYAAVKLNTDLKTDEFVFTPPQKVRVEDRTQTLVTRLDQEIQFRAAAKKAEAAKAEDPLFEAVDRSSQGCPACRAFPVARARQHHRAPGRAVKDRLR